MSRLRELLGKMETRYEAGRQAVRLAVGSGSFTHYI